MRMIDEIIRAMQDTGLIDGMSVEDADTLATAALESLNRNSTFKMKAAGAREWKVDPENHHGTFGIATDTFNAMIDAALNE